MQHDSGYQRYETIAVYLFAVGGDNRGSVHVGIENNSEVGIVFYRTVAYSPHGLLVFGIGNMVGKGAVGLQKLRTGYVGAQRLQYAAGVKSARSVAGVHHNMQAR